MPTGPTKPSRRFLVRQTFDVTERQRLAIELGQPIQLLPDHLPQLGAKFAGSLLRSATFRPASFRTPAAGQHGNVLAAPCGRPPPGAIAPVTQDPESTRAFRTSTKNVALKRVLGFVRVVEHTAADLEHRRPMPDHQVPERHRVALSHKAIQQLAIARDISPA